jgi:hypothetical protein
MKSTAPTALTVCLLLLCCLATSSCATLRTLIPGGVTASDAEWSGIKSSSHISITGIAAADPRAQAAIGILDILGQSDPLGVLLPVTLVGETVPRWILCEAGPMADKCRQIPLNAKVHFAGSPIGPGLLWRPTRLTADDFND